jgi:hypothetical protein
MNEEKPAWAKMLAEPPFVNRPFTADLKAKVLLRAGKSPRKRFSVGLAVCAPLVAVLLFIGLLHFRDESSPIGLDSDSGLSGEPAARNSYVEQGRLLFTLFPEPNAKAGKMNGYMIHFEEPLETFLGKTLTLYAVHRLTGIKQTVSSEVITKPSPGYAGLGRYTASFALPLGGMWELYVQLNEKPYGHVQLSLLEPSWDVARVFRSGTYAMRGVENKVGFIDAGFIAGEPQKAMWHFWGGEELLNGPFEVKAVKQGSDRIIDVFSSNPLSSANALAGELNGADRHIVTSMMLPEAGRWRLLPYVRGRLLDPIVVEVFK